MGGPAAGGPAAPGPAAGRPVGHAAEQPDPAGRFGGLVVPDPGFPGDDGAPDPAVRAALLARAEGTGSARALVAALASARLLVPVVAVVDSIDQATSALPGEKDSHLSTVSLVGPDGRRGLLVFTGLDALAAWDPGARPVPVRGALAARAAQDDGCTALVIDAAGPVPGAVESVALDGLAAGGAWPPAHADPLVRAAVAAGALSVPGVARVRLDPGGADPADVVVVLDVSTQAPAADVAQQVADRLAGDPVLHERLVRSLQVAVR